MKKHAPLVCVVGQTASGKSSLALQIAQTWDGEIICADSWTVRRKVNIGTAKPTPEEQRLIPHHLLDIVEPDEDFNAALFKEMANEAIADILARGKLPIMVGGSGLYIDSVIYDYSFLSTGDQDDRGRLNSLSIPQLLHEIERLSLPQEGVDIRNKRRLIRLIEAKGARPTRNSLRNNTLLLGLQVEPDQLVKNITTRVDVMIKLGLEEEVGGLAEQYGWQCEALKGISYAQWKPYFLGTESRQQVRQKIIQATISLAKRQKTWFQRNKSIQWLTTPVKWPEVVGLVTTFMDNSVHQ